MEEKTKKYIFNPYYGLKNDKKRIVLCNAPAFKIPAELAEDEISSFIHPVYAMAFSFFDGNNSLENCLNKISELFGASIEESYDFLKPFLDNKERVGIDYDKHVYEFPKRILLDNSEFNFPVRQLNYEDYVIDDELDFSTYRLYEGPTAISILVNTLCQTDCIYCYVDRKNKIDCEIPIERICELIREAKKDGVITFDISGTEIFLYKYWDILVDELLKNGYYPYLSTKVPISGEILRKLKELGIKDLQLSIDTADNKEAKIVNKVKIDNYADAMLDTLARTEQFGFNMAVNAVITKYNCSEKGIKQLLDAINKQKNIEKVTLNPAESSMYCHESQFNDLKMTIEQITAMEDFIDSIKSNYGFTIHIAGYIEEEAYKNDFATRQKKFRERAMCTANITQVCILPDGQVTICEELYWHPKFLIGNVVQNAMKEIWNSESALALANIKRDSVSAHSPCKTCKEFDSCRQFQGVCWSDVLSVYGEDNWDFPASDCPYAPFPYHAIYHENEKK
ncbi:radical SAM/SPASM domain-containing protein [Bacteroidia bacterium]|nr:radical SAM/SPASM domain-containing protein [Bacteroidia bacterium]